MVCCDVVYGVVCVVYGVLRYADDSFNYYEIHPSMSPFTAHDKNTMERN